MAKKVQGDTKSGIARKSKATPRCIALLDQGITNSYQFLNANHAVIADVVSARITPTMANAAFAGGRNTLKMLEIQQKYGRSNGKDANKMLEIGTSNK